MSEHSLKDLGQFLRGVAFDYGDAGEVEDKELLEECAKIVEAKPINMGHFDSIEGALTSAAMALTAGARTREWDSLQAAMGTAWADIQRAIGYTKTLKSRVSEGDGFSGEEE